MRGAESRVTVDVDPVGSWVIRAQRAWHGLQQLADDVDVRVSSSGEGLHIIGWFEDALSTETKDVLRRTLGDDPNRIYLDTIRDRVGHMQQVLWTEKKGQQADTDFGDLYAAIDTVRANKGKVGNGVMSI